MKTLRVLAFILSASFASSQNKEIDSLISLLKSTKSGQEFKNSTSELLMSLTKNYPSQFKSPLLNKVSEIEVVAGSQKDNKLIARANLLLGVMYENLMAQDSSIYYYFNAVHSFEKAGDFESVASTYYRIARIYFYKGNLPEALKYTNKIVAYLDQSSDKNSSILATPYMFKAVILQNMKDSLPAADKCYQKAISIAEINKLSVLGSLYNNYGEFLNICNVPLEKSFLYFEKAKKHALMNNDSSVIAYSAFSMGNIYCKINKYNEAISSITPYLNYFFKTKRLSELLESYDVLYRCYESKGDFKSMSFYLKRYKILNDSVTKLTNEQTLAELNTKFEVEKKDKQLLQLKEKAVIEELEKEKQENRSQILLIGISVSLLFGGFALFAYYNKQKANKLLDSEKKLVEEQKEILEVKNREILDSINYAKRIQRAILPADSLFKYNFNEYFIYYKPKDIVAGDFYWLHQKDDSVYIAVCDCTGHGVPGALVSVVCNNSLDRAINEFGLTLPSDILNKTRELVKEAFTGNEENVNDGMDMSLLCFPAKRKSEEITIQFSGANNPVWFFANNEMNVIEADKQPIGNYTNEKPFNNTEITVSCGTFYLFTDGYADQFGGPKGKKFKYKQLNELLISCNGKPLAEQREILSQTFKNWKGNLEQVDDVCVIGIRV